MARILKPSERGQLRPRSQSRESISFRKIRRTKSAAPSPTGWGVGLTGAKQSAREGGSQVKDSPRGARSWDCFVTKLHSHLERSTGFWYRTRYLQDSCTSSRCAGACECGSAELGSPT